MSTALLPPEIVNARLFCAGNGTTDDTEALQSLLNAGGDIYLPFGSSFLATSLTFAVPGTRLFGPGKLVWSSGNTIDNCASGAVITGGIPNRVNVAGNVISKCTSVPIFNNGTIRGLAANGNMTDQNIPTIASAASVTVPLGIDTILISGTTTITTVSTNSGFPGRKITLIFTGALTVNNTGNIIVGGGSFATAANSTLTLVCDGSGNWYEIGRKA
jgi:hypothetical protein